MLAAGTFVGVVMHRIDCVIDYQSEGLESWTVVL